MFCYIAFDGKYLSERGEFLRGPPQIGSIRIGAHYLRAGLGEPGGNPCPVPLAAPVTANICRPAGGRYQKLIYSHRMRIANLLLDIITVYQARKVLQCFRNASRVC